MQYSDFEVYTGWANTEEKQEMMKSFYPYGSWTVEDAGCLGVPKKFLSNEEKEKVKLTM